MQPRRALLALFEELRLKLLLRADPGEEVLRVEANLEEQLPASARSPSSSRGRRAARRASNAVARAVASTASLA